MATSTLPRGSFLLVFPEDVEGAIASPVYAKIKSSRGATATVTLVNEGDDSETTLKLARATALTRKVDSSDAEGSKLGTWIRQAVCVKHEGHYNYGQVTGYSDAGLIIYTLSGPIEASRTDICDTVYPVIALMMGCQVFPEEAWSYEQLDQIHDMLMDRLLRPPTTDAPCDPLSIAQLVQGVLPDVSPGFDRLCYWTDARTGKRSRISLQHVVNYVYYVDGGKRLPASMEGQFGPTFCTPPVQDMHPQQQDPTARPEHPTTASATRSSFFDVLDVDDGEETAADEAALAQTILAGVNESTSPTLTAPRNRMQHPRHTASSPATNPTYAVPHDVGSSAAAPPQLYQEASEETEIRDLIRMHKPHLLTYHLESRRAPISAAKRAASTEDDSQPAKRGKFSFAPSAEQRRVHDAITSDAQRGKSASEFVESLVSSSELWAYPGVATRAYDIEFGSRGLSFLHFAPADPLLRLRRQRESFINMSDFSVSAKFMPAPDPASWEEVLSGANGFQQYCFTRCDPVTQNLATTLYNFVVELKSCNLWPQNMLLTLVLWIDAQLEKYRVAVVADIDHATSTRQLISMNFSSHNVELHGLLLVEQRKQMEAMVSSSRGQATSSGYQPTPSRNLRPSSSGYRKTPDDTPSLPQQDGKDVCLKFLSKRGCPSKDPSVCIFQSRVHFYPAAISDQLRNFIRRRFGGVNSKYTNN